MVALVVPFQPFIGVPIRVPAISPALARKLYILVDRKFGADKKILRLAN
jgi:hypothetical protein